MSTVDLTLLTKKLAKVTGLKHAIMPKAFDYFKHETPIRTGNARNHTYLSKDVIKADYNYASVLDKGRGMQDGRMRGSTQAPIGMSKPTIKQFTKWVSDYLKGIR